MIVTMPRGRFGTGDKTVHQPQIAAILHATAELIGAVAAGYGFMRMIPMVLDRARLLAENAALKERTRIAEEMLEAYQRAAEGWEMVRDEVQTLRAQFGSAILYITDLVAHSKNGGSYDSIPPFPDDLQEAINETWRRRVAKVETKT